MFIQVFQSDSKRTQKFINATFAKFGEISIHSNFLKVSSDQRIVEIHVRIKN